MTPKRLFVLLAIAHGYRFAYNNEQDWLEENGFVFNQAGHLKISELGKAAINKAVKGEIVQDTKSIFGEKQNVAGSTLRIARNRTGT